MKSLLARLTGAPGAAAEGPAEAPAPELPSDAAALREAVLDGGLDAVRARALGEALLAEGRPRQALEALTLANRLAPDPALEWRLVRLRHDAFSQLDRSLPSPSWPPFAPDDPPGTSGPPEVGPGELTTGLLRRGILRHGCVLVRGLVPSARVERLVRSIDRAFEALDGAAAGRAGPEHAPWFTPLERIPNGDELRGWVRDGHGVLAAESPRTLFELLETVHELGLAERIAGHLGEPAALSAEKCTLRRVEPTVTLADWHQDGAFLGKGIRTVNAWFALSRCGRDAPGLDIVPRRLELLPTGEEGSIFDWAVSPATIARELPGVRVWRPEFEPGDVLLFDHQCLHRTAAEPTMTRRRYAIESWFFAASCYPEGSTPLVV